MEADTGRAEEVSRHHAIQVQPFSDQREWRRIEHQHKYVLGEEDRKAMITHDVRFITRLYACYGPVLIIEGKPEIYLNSCEIK